MMHQGEASDGNEPPRKRRRALGLASHSLSESDEDSSESSTPPHSRDERRTKAPDTTSSLSSPMEPAKRGMLIAFLQIWQDCNLMALMWVGLLSALISNPSLGEEAAKTIVPPTRRRKLQVHTQPYQTNFIAWKMLYSDQAFFDTFRMYKEDFLALQLLLEVRR